MSNVVLYLVITLLIGLLFIIRNRSEDTASKYFQLTLAFILLWTVSILFTQIDSNSSHVIWWSRLSFVFPIGVALSLHPFVYALVERVTNVVTTVRQKHISRLFYVFGGLFSCASLTPLIVTSVRNYQSVFGLLQIPYSIFILSSFIWVGYNLFKGIRTTRGNQNSQLLLVFIGITTSTGVAFITNLIGPILGFGEHRELGPAALVLLVGFSAYAIFAHHLFDIKIIIRRTIIYSALLLVLFSGFSVIVLLAPTIFPAQNQEQRFLIQFIASVVVGFSFDPLKRWLQDHTDKFLYKKEYEQQNVIKDLSNQLNNVIGLDEALEIVMQTIIKTFRVNKAVTYIFQPGEHGSTAIKRIKQIGFGKEAALMLTERDFIVEYFSSSAQIVTVNQLKENYSLEASQTKKRPSTKRILISSDELSNRIRANARLDVVIRKLTSLGAEVVVPLHLGDQFIGLLLLSSKLSDDAFTSSDVQLLELAGQAAISSIQKARLYEGDQMKSEFVSIASHELLTPISAIEGYLSIILDENIGVIDDQARNYLTKVYTSSRRLSQLVKDLLSVSRIESGRMSVNLQAVDVAKLIKETLEQLHFLAQNKGLELNYHATAKALPLVMADPDRVTQVLTNLVSNAIKYTPTGSVTVKASATKDNELRVSVSDTGLGMTRQARSHLFEKFYRIASDETVGIIGTGLGLYITRSILEKMDGAITVESVPKQGSTFTITLPCFEAEDVIRYP